MRSTQRQTAITMIFHAIRNGKDASLVRRRFAQSMVWSAFFAVLLLVGGSSSYVGGVVPNADGVARSSSLTIGAGCDHRHDCPQSPRHCEHARRSLQTSLRSEVEATPVRALHRFDVELGVHAPIDADGVRRGAPCDLLIGDRPFRLTFARTMRMLT